MADIRAMMLLYTNRRADLEAPRFTAFCMAYALPASDAGLSEKFAFYYTLALRFHENARRRRIPLRRY